MLFFNQNKDSILWRVNSVAAELSTTRPLTNYFLSLCPLTQQAHVYPEEHSNPAGEKIALLQAEECVWQTKPCLRVLYRRLSQSPRASMMTVKQMTMNLRQLQNVGEEPEMCSTDSHALVYIMCVSILRMHSENMVICAECRAAVKSTH